MRLIDADVMIRDLKKLSAKQSKRYGQNDISVTMTNAIIADIEAMPTVEPQRIKGSWIQISPGGIYECSICGKYVMTPNIYAYDYCHGCGNPMGVIKNGNERTSQTAQSGT